MENKIVYFDDFNFACNLDQLMGLYFEYQELDVKDENESNKKQDVEVKLRFMFLVNETKNYVISLTKSGLISFYTWIANQIGYLNKDGFKNDKSVFSLFNINNYYLFVNKEHFVSLDYEILDSELILNIKLKYQNANHQVVDYVYDVEFNSATELEKFVEKKHNFLA